MCSLKMKNIGNIDLKLVPQHVAIIMDGNGRWAKRCGLSRSEGHRKGVERVREIVEEAARLKIKVLTLYAFSTENWKRPKREINLLMRLLKVFLNREIKNFNKNNIRFECIGRIKELPGSVVEIINKARKITKDNNGLVLNLALNYGSRPEIIDAVNNIIKDCSSGELAQDGLDEDTFSQYLYTKNFPDPDLLIRTSGEQRISNFLLWQISYTELFFSNKLWPDFTADDFFKAILDYQNRARRFGGV